ncbi:MAG: FAD-dependent oxidoreductase [Candidatus Hydrogenedentes bacterium]|nr:FAD-dependent oxidoreductase [Candidatus Hydrogenedentota bacterium]
MAAKSYDVVIVGGGITGACIARDAALRGLSVALVEKNDFAGATTAASSKLIHGGLRYLQNLELGLVRESLRERRIWSNTAPHMIEPLTFLMPMTKSGIKDRMFKGIGLTLYDWLAYDRNRLDDPEKSIPAHKKLNRKETLALEPSLETEDLTGAMIFYDYQMYSPERLALECILSAAEAGADLANYAEVTGFVVEDGMATGVHVRDCSPGSGAWGLGFGEGNAAGKNPNPKPQTPDPMNPVRMPLSVSDYSEQAYLLRGRIVINAAGPWADLLMGTARRDAGAASGEPSRHLIRSKGIHLLTRPLTQGHAIAVQSKGGHFFILPWRGYSILGTTDTVYKGEPDKVHVTEKDIIEFLGVINKGYPSAKLTRSDVLYFYCGLRPIVDTTTPVNQLEQPASEAQDSDSYKASRAAEVFDHEAQDGLKGLLTVIGGKWTTSRHLAEKVVDLACAKLGKTGLPCTTDHVPTYGGGTVGRFAEFKQQALDKHADMPAETVENLARNYGGRMEEVLALLDENPKWMDRLSDRFPDIAAQVVYAVRREMALTLDDVLFRRTGLGTIGSPGDAAIARAADLMALELGWNHAERAAQINRAKARFTSWARTRAVVNPHAWGDRTGAIWPRIESSLSHAIGPVEAAFTDGPMAAQRLTAQALKDGMEQIIAVGGDGTINEVINGFFESGRPINPDAVLAVVTSGTGRDFRRTYGLPEEMNDQIERMAASELRTIDLGKLTFINERGQEETRYFGNIASFGLSGATDRAVNRLKFSKRFGGKFAFFVGMLKALLTYRNQPVRIQIDDVFDKVLRVSTAAVCNGQYFGGSMHIAPQAVPDDGLFDVVIIHSLSLPTFLRNVGTIYRGKHVSNEHVTIVRGRRVTALPVEGAGEVLLDVDGEAPGRLPATFEILPAAIHFRC